MPEKFCWKRTDKCSGKNVQTIHMHRLHMCAVRIVVVVAVDLRDRQAREQAFNTAAVWTVLSRNGAKKKERRENNTIGDECMRKNVLFCAANFSTWSNTTKYVSALCIHIYLTIFHIFPCRSKPYYSCHWRSNGVAISIDLLLSCWLGKKQLHFSYTLDRWSPLNSVYGQRERVHSPPVDRQAHAPSATITSIYRHFRIAIIFILKVCISLKMIYEFSRNLMKKIDVFRWMCYNCLSRRTVVATHFNRRMI